MFMNESPFTSVDTSPQDNPLDKNKPESAYVAQASDYARAGMDDDLNAPTPTTTRPDPKDLAYDDAKRLGLTGKGASAPPSTSARLSLDAARQLLSGGSASKPATPAADTKTGTISLEEARKALGAASGSTDKTEGPSLFRPGESTVDKNLGVAAGTLDVVDTFGRKMMSGVAQLPGDVIDWFSTAFGSGGNKVAKDINKWIAGMEKNPETEEGQAMMNSLSSAMKKAKITDAAEWIHKASEGLFGPEGTKLLGDLLNVLPFAKTPGASAAESAAKAAPKIGTAQKIMNIADELQGGSRISKAEASTAMKGGIKATEAEAKAAAGDVYEELNKIMPGKTDVEVSNTVKLLKQLGTGFAPNPTIEKLLKRFQVEGEDVGSVSFESLRSLRTQVNDLMGDKGTALDRQLKQVKEAMDKDIDVAAGKLKGSAKEKWAEAKQKWGAYKDSQRLMDDILGSRWQRAGAETLWQRLFQKGKVAPTEMQEVLSRIKDPNVARMFVGSMIEKMGYEEGAFSAEKFSKEFLKMDPDARKTLFGVAGGGYGENLEKLVQNMQKIMKGREVAKSIGGATGFGGGGLVFAFTHDVKMASTVALILKGVKAFRYRGELTAAMQEYLLTNPTAVRALRQASETAAKASGAAAGTVDDVAAAAAKTAQGGSTPRDPVTGRFMKKKPLSSEDASKPVDRSSQRLL